MPIGNVPYNLTGLYDATTVVQLFSTANTFTGEILMGIFLIAIFFIMILVMRRFEFTHTLLTASFICLILSLFLRYAGLLNFVYIIIFATLTAFSAFIVYFESR